MKKIIVLTMLIASYSILMAADQRPQRKSSQEVFAEMDTDGNGSVSESEWIAYHKTKFSEMDKDEDGSLSEEELRPPRPPRGERRDK